MAVVWIVGGVCLAGYLLFLKRKNKFHSIKRKDRWSIGIYAGNSPYRLAPPAGIRNPVLRAGDVTDRKAQFVADPFMTKEKDMWYMFFEVLDARRNKGDIGLAESRDGLHWAYRQVVLRESFHLSYPYVFSWEGVYYMIPESYRAREVRLYKAVEFPLRWAFVASLLIGSNFSDNSIVRYQDRWWMFTTEAETGYFDNGTLRIYYADELLGPWKEHPRSPVIQGDDRIARPGGRVLVFGEGLIRFAQDDHGTYGNAVHAFEITKLSVSDYEERQVSGNPILKASGRGWNKDGMHHVDPHQIGEGAWIACVDGNAHYVGF